MLISNQALWSTKNSAVAHCWAMAHKQGWESIPKKVKKKSIFDCLPKSREIIDFDGSLKK